MKRILAVGVFALLGLFPAMDIPEFTPWSTPVNLGPVVNSTFSDQCASISKNGLSLYFSSGRFGGSMDLFVSQRASAADAWGVPERLPNVNTASSETCPSLSLDEHRLYFASTRAGGCGAGDFYVSRRHDRTDDFGWEPPENLGCVADGYVNTSGSEGTPNFFEDESGNVVMYFATYFTTYHLYMSVMRDDDTFGPGTPITELNSSYSDYGPAVRRDGLEIIFTSTRPGGLGSSDLWTSTRESTSDPWSPPVNLTVLNSPSADFGKTAFSFDGLQFYFSSGRPGGFGSNDLYAATREKLRGKR